MEKSAITAIILAAGYSERMGRFKPLLDLGGQPAIERIINSFKGAGIIDVRVVAGYSKERLIPVLERLDVCVIVNDRYTDGMFSSVQTAVRSLSPSTEAFFLMPADMPLVRAGTIRYLAESYKHHRDKILTPVFNGRRGHPPLIAARFAGSIMNYSGEGGLAAILSLHNADIMHVPVPDSNILLDMDNPGDYEDIQKKLPGLDIPTAAECEVILENVHAVPDKVIEHSRVVANVALLIVDEMNRHGFDIDKGLVLAAALLHDLAKGKPAHAAESARMVREMGYAGVAKLIEAHTDIVPGAGDDVSAEEVLYLADKLVNGDRVVPLSERFGRAMDRYGDKPETADKIRIRQDNAVGILLRIEARTGALNFESRIATGAQL